jgi:spermidine synthase
MAKLEDQAGIFTERLHRQYWQSIAIDGAPVAKERSAFQEIEIFDSPQNGRVLTLDRIVQLTSRDECAYSEMLAHVPIFEHGEARNVLIVGGGDCCIAEEVLKHRGIALCELAEIDERVVELCRVHFKPSNGATFADPRFKINIVDAAEFLRDPKAEGRYDVIISDRPDPVGPAGVLFEESFYRSVSRALSPRGIAVFQTGVPHYQPDELVTDQTELARAFKHTGVMLTVVPTYVGGFMALSWASNGHVLGSAEGIARARAAFPKAGFSTDYYTPEMHEAAFALPAWVKRLAEKAPETVKGGAG